MIKSSKRLRTLKPSWTPPEEIRLGINKPSATSSEFVLVSLYDWDRFWDDVPLGDARVYIRDFVGKTAQIDVK